MLTRNILCNKTHLIRDTVRRKQKANFPKNCLCQKLQHVFLVKNSDFKENLSTSKEIMIKLLKNILTLHL